MKSTRNVTEGYRLGILEGVLGQVNEWNRLLLSVVIVSLASRGEILEGGKRDWVRGWGGGRESSLCNVVVLKKWYSNHLPLSNSATTIKLSFSIQSNIVALYTQDIYSCTLCMSLSWIFSFSTSNQWSLQQLGFDYHKGNQFQSSAASFQKHYVKLIYCWLTQQYWGKLRAQEGKGCLKSRQCPQRWKSL